MSEPIQPIKDKYYVDKRMYASIAQLCKEKGFDKKFIRAASSMGLPGFNPNRSINFALLSPALKANEAELLIKSADGKSMEELKKEEKELGNKLKRLEIKKKEASYVDPAEWYQWHSEFGTKLSNAINSTRKHLMGKCVGYEKVIDSEFINLFNLIKNEIAKCEQK